MKNSLNLWAVELVGRRLTSVEASLFVFAGTIEYRNPQQLRLDFETLSSGYITCSSDGISLEFVSGPLEEFDMGAGGQRILANMSDQQMFRPVIGHTLSKVILSMDMASKSPVAASFYFNAGELHIANLGDEMFVYPEYPASSFKGEKIILESI